MESWKTMFTRWYFNFFPAYRGTGARITYISHDWREARIRLPLNWRTRNYVGSIYGGSMYGAVDPFYMIMLIKLLGKGYVVWDKAATIQFKKPGCSTLYASFCVSKEEIDEIKRELTVRPSMDRSYIVELKDAEGVVHATIEKILYIASNEVK